MQALWLTWKGGILLKPLCKLDILYYIQLCLKPLTALIPSLEEKNNFSLAITLTKVSFRKITNERSSKSKNLNFKRSIGYLKKMPFFNPNKLECVQVPKRIMNFLIKIYKLMLGLSLSLEFNFDAKYKDENSIINATIVRVDNIIKIWCKLLQAKHVEEAEAKATALSIGMAPMH